MPTKRRRRSTNLTRRLWIQGRRQRTRLEKLTEWSIILIADVSTLLYGTEEEVEALYKT